MSPSATQPKIIIVREGGGFFGIKTMQKSWAQLAKNHYWKTSKGAGDTNMKKYKILRGNTPKFRGICGCNDFFWEIGGGRFEKIQYFVILWASRGGNIGKKPYLTTYQG